MGWAIGYDGNWKRDIGYGVPSICDHPDCDEKIDRGLAYVCGSEPHGGDVGCGLFFCPKHLIYGRKGKSICARCQKYRKPFEAKPDVREWIEWKLTDESWSRWRSENPDFVKQHSETV